MFGIVDLRLEFIFYLLTKKNVKELDTKWVLMPSNLIQLENWN